MLHGCPPQAADASLGTDSDPVQASLEGSRLPVTHDGWADRAGLVVEPQQVVVGESESADGRLRFYAAMRAMPVAAVEPRRQLCGAVRRGRIGAGLRLAEERLRSPSFVGQDLGEGDARGVVEADVDELPADAAALAGAMLTGDAVADLL
jgi:hypothetical protein